MRAKKSYGQHFLNNEDISENIAQSLRPNGAFGKVLEIGPGKGMLTKYLLKAEYDLLTIEADRDMVGYLLSNYPQLEGRIIQQDFLKANLDRLFEDVQFGIIGNFPYNISSQILFRMLEHKDQIPKLVGMFQKEMAERVVAKPGKKDFGVISVLVQAYYDGEYLFTVDKSNFSPPPKVQSAVIRLTRKENQELGCSYKAFRRVVKQAFSQRRKMLRNTMKTFLKGDEFLQDPFFQQRPEQLSVADFVWLTNNVEKRMKN